MDLEYCKDFAKKRNRWLDFWNGKNTRAMVTCERPKAGAEAVSKPHSYHLAFGDINEEISKTEAWVERTEFLADSIPYYQVTFTPDHFSLFLGAELGYNPDSPDTTWVEPFDRELKDIDVRFDPESKWWKRTAECMEAFQEHFRGKIMTVATHLQGGVDCLAALRGPQNFLFDIMDHPDLVKEKLRDVNTAMMDARKSMWDTLECGTWGSMNRFGMYCDEYIDVPQCDFSCMISREMFDEFQLPVLTEEINALKGNIYHFDGPDALQHTESLCSIDNLHMIQWQPGVGHYDTDWTWLYEKIDSLGTGLVFQGFSGLDRNGKIDIWRNFDSKKILFQTWGDDAEHIDEFLEKLEEVGK